MKYLLLPLLFISFLPLGAEESQEHVARTCRILFLGKPPEALKEAYLFDGKNSQKVYLSSMGFSEVIELPSGNIALGIFAEAVSASDEFNKSALTVSIPEEVTDFFLLAESDPDNKAMPVKLKFINIGEQRLNPGETLWINQTKHMISAKLGDQALTVPPMRRAKSDAPLKEGGYFKAQFTYQRNAEGDFLPIMRKSWWCDPNSKNLGFIVETNARLPKIFTIRDHRK